MHFSFEVSPLTKSAIFESKSVVFESKSVMLDSKLVIFESKLVIFLVEIGQFISRKLIHSKMFHDEYDLPVK